MAGNVNVRARVRNALIGIAYGDSFGMPVEMWNPKTIQEKVGRVTALLPGQPDNPISRNLCRGSVTDDTMNSLIVTDVLYKNHGRIDAGMFIGELKHWMDTSKSSAAVVGPSTRRAIELIDQGVSMEVSGSRGTTNGGAMKIIPVGLVNGLAGVVNKEKLVRDVVELLKPTHFTSGAVSSACAIAGGAAIAVTGESNIETVFNFMVEMAEQGSAFGMQWGGPSVAARMKLGRYFVEQYAEGEALDSIYRIIGTSVSSEESIPAASALLLLSDGDPEKCAELCTNIGGDTDTMSAMAVGICGAMSEEENLFDSGNIDLIEKVNGLSFDQWTDKIMDCVK
jgi:ADP-ribosylglycohydrolase